jgi:hypothetical protein
VALVHEFLGCDPTVAGRADSRADCERYGVHGDAAAHGFARLRDGGAVDLQREMPVGSVIDRFGARLVCKPPWRLVPPNERFIGLDTRHASPEDVRRLCCGEVAYTYRDGKDVLCQCTLAIGPHEHHEDLATGARWAAQPKLVPGTPLVASYSAAPQEKMPRLRASFSEPLRAVRTPLTDTFVPRERFVFVADKGDGTVYDVTSITDGVFVCTCGTSDPEKHGAGCSAPWWIREASARAWAEWKRTGDMGAVGKMAQEAAIGACVLGLFVFLRRLWSTTREGREAPLVALVNACPEGLDPDGWRAAVLACHETTGTDDTIWFVRDENGSGRSIERQLREARTPEHEPLLVAAYQRALAPRAKVPPERKRRGPAIVVDDGRDD